LVFVLAVNQNKVSTCKPAHQDIVFIHIS